MLEHEMSFYIVFCQGKQATTKQPDLDPIAIPVKKQGASIGRSSSIEKKHMMKGGARTRGPNNNISLETITFNDNHDARTHARARTHTHTHTHTHAHRARVDAAARARGGSAALPAIEHRNVCLETKLAPWR